MFQGSQRMAKAQLIHLAQPTRQGELIGENYWSLVSYLHARIGLMKKHLVISSWTPHGNVQFSKKPDWEGRKHD